MKVITYFFIFFLAFLFPFFRFYSTQFHTHLIGDGIDNLLVLTILERNLLNFNSFFQTLELSKLYTSQGFYPYSDTALFTEPMYFPSILYGLLKTIFQDSTKAYNSLLILASIINFYSFFYLCRVLKFDLFITTLGSLIFSNGHYFTIQYIHLQNQFAFGFPLVFGLILQYKKTNQISSVFLISITLLLQFFSCNYYGLFLFYFFFLSIILIGFVFPKNITKRKLNVILLSKKTFSFFLPALLFILTIFSLYYQFFKKNIELYPKRIIEENAIYSNSLLSFLTLPKKVILYSNTSFEGTTHSSAHIGFVTLCLILYFFSKFHKLHRRIVIYLCCALLFYLLSIGPFINLFQHQVPGPYSILYYLAPGFKNIRVPSRIFILSWFFISIAFASYSFYSKEKSKKIFLNVVLIILILEFSFTTKIKESSKSIISNLNIIQSLEGNSTVLFLKKNKDLLTFDAGSIPEWYLLNTKIKTPNGYTGITFPFQYYLINLLYHYQNSSKLYEYLKLLGITHIAVTEEANQISNQTNLWEVRSRFFPLRLVGNDRENQIMFYRISENIVHPDQNKYTLNPIPFRITEASVSKKIGNLTDNDLNSYWRSFSSGYQSQEDFLKIQLEKVPKNKLLIHLYAGPFVERLPYALDVKCNGRKAEFDLIPIDIQNFMKDPIKNSKQEIIINHCDSDQIEIRVKKTTPYAVLMLSEIKFFETDK